MIDPKSRKPAGLRVTLEAESSWFHFVEVSGLSAASEAMLTFVGVNEYGQDDLTARCGEVRDGSSNLVARVSPNGKVWDTRPYPQCECIYDPYQKGE